MKIFNGMSLKTIRRNLALVGVEMNDEQFNALTYAELRKIYRKSKKAYGLYRQVDIIINEPKTATLAIAMPTSDKDKNAKGF